MNIDLIQDTDNNELMARLKKPLFERCSASGCSAPNDVTCTKTESLNKPSDMVVHTIPIWYAVTVNPQPTKTCNKRQYRKYTDSQQIGILTRMEAKLRREYPSITLIELHYEKCPTLGQMHFHAKYSMPARTVTDLEEYWRRVLDSSDANTKVPWRYLDIQEVYNDQGWLDYIRKDTKTGYKGQWKELSLKAKKLF